MHLRDQRAVARAASTTPVVLMAFDLLGLDGESLVDRPLGERLARLGEVLVPGPAVRISEAVPEHGTALYEAAGAQGLEGLVAKRADSPYRPGQRSRDWRKLKVRRMLCGVIGGWLPGEGARAGGLGSLLVGLYAPAGGDGAAPAGSAAAWTPRSWTASPACSAPVRSTSPPSPTFRQSCDASAAG